jgi:hypothetical protein
MYIVYTSNKDHIGYGFIIESFEMPATIYRSNILSEAGMPDSYLNTQVIR